MSAPITFSLSRNAFGRLVLTTLDGSRHENIVPVRAFPVTAPQSGLSLVSADGHELAWLDNPEQLAEPARSLLQEELASREFMPEIEKLLHVSTFATPSQWQVETSRGSTTLTLKSEDDIRRLTPHTLLITDSNGIQYLIRDRQMLDKHSSKLLNRFL